MKITINPIIWLQFFLNLGFLLSVHYFWGFEIAVLVGIANILSMSTILGRKLRD